MSLPEPLEWRRPHGSIRVDPTVNPDGTDAGGAKVRWPRNNPHIEMRMTKNGAIFIRGLESGNSPFRDAQQFLSWITLNLEALKRFQDRR
jgi:hypothetical protein